MTERYSRRTGPHHPSIFSGRGVDEPREMKIDVVVGAKTSIYMCERDIEKTWMLLMIDQLVLVFFNNGDYLSIAHF